MPRYSRRFVKRRRYGGRYGRRFRGRRTFSRSRRSFGRKMRSSRFARRVRGVQRRSRVFRRIRRARAFRTVRTEGYTAVQDTVPFPLAHDPTVGVISYTVDYNNTSGAVNANNVSYNTGFRLGLPTTPALFGSTTNNVSLQGYEFVYAPILTDSITSSVSSGGVQNVLRNYFAEYQYFRVKSMTVIMRRVGLPVYVNATGANSYTKGAEGFVMCCRYGGPIVSRTEVKNDTNWTADDVYMNSAFGQMQNMYPVNRRRMKYVRDFQRQRSIKFKFAPTVITPDFRMAFQNGRSMVAPASLPGYQPNVASGGEGNPTKMSRFRWRQTYWKDVAGTTPVLGTGIQLWGLCGALKIGSWAIGSWVPWEFRSYIRLEFKGKRINGTTYNYQSYPLYNTLSAFLPNQSYNLNNV